MASETPAGPDPTLYLYTSLTAGSSHIITATSRLETILKANKIAFRALDCATDEKARTLWGRRSKGRKLPGLVKYGQVIGDLKEVEEWNEYGEIKENIENVSDLFGDTPMTDTPMPPPAPITLKDPLAKTSQPPSRSSSETRHISISDPKDKDGSLSSASSLKNLKDDTPMALAMRQAGAEAAAKAGQRKASGTSSLKSTSTATSLPAKRDSTDTTPTATAVRGSIDAEDPAEATEITAAKTPAQLATEGAKKTSVDKIAGQSPTEGSSLLAAEPEKSNEEQLLEARTSSSVAKIPSRLAQETSIDEVQAPSEQALVSDTNLPGTTSHAGETQPQHHRGSSLSEASKEEIKEIEQRNAIKEESEEDDHTGSAAKSKVSATDEVEAEVMKDTKPQEQEAKDADAAGVSAAMFLSPNLDPKPNRLSADSASVYSFFDSAFSPAPLFSGEKNLNLDLSFMEALGGESDPRTSISTYGTDDLGINGTRHLMNPVGDHDETPRKSQDMQRENSVSNQPQESPTKRERLPSIPVIAPLRTPVHRQVSEPLLTTTLNRSSTASTSIPLPLKIRKSPSTTTSPTSVSESPSDPPVPFQPSRSQPHLQTQPSPSSPTQQLPSSPNAVTPTESRSLRFRKSIRSLRSKKSTPQLSTTGSPLREVPPNLPPQRQLRDAGGGRSVSDGAAAFAEKKAGGPQKSSVKNLLCF